jgi:serine/threonine protein phosphatase 1
MTENTKKNRRFYKHTYVVADIHGCDEALLNVLGKVNFDYENDRLIQLGDLVDRGENSWEVLEILLKVKNLILIKGNHDEMFRLYLDNYDPKFSEQWYHTWLMEFAPTTIKSYASHECKNLDEHIKLLDSAVPYYIENNCIFTHGGFNRNILVEEQHPSVFTYDRELVYEMMSFEGEKFENKNGFDCMYLGHTPTLYWEIGQEIKLNKDLVLEIKNPIYYPIIKHGIHMLDCGAGKGGPLTIYDLDNSTWIQSDKKY